jgi:hypothetical protein
MSPQEQLFALEVEFYRRLRAEVIGTADTIALHISYALQSGYEPLLRRVGRVTDQDIVRMADRFTLAGDVRDMLAARDSLTSLLGVRAGDP